MMKKNLYTITINLLIYSLFLVVGIVGISIDDIQAQKESNKSVSQPLHISDDGRWFIYEDGSPFFYLADTAWELFHRLDREEADLYLSDRAAKGFTVIQAVVLAELDGLDTPNPYGHTPLIDNDPTKPNEPYFQHVDYIVERAEELGLVIGMLPTWGDKFNPKWGVGPDVFSRENARTYGEYLGNRYKNNNIIWLMGGDRNPEEDEDFGIIRNMAEGIRSAEGNRQLMTYHPQGGSKSYQWFHNDDWLDFNMFQSSHSRFDIPNYKFTEEGYALTPVKPVVDGEPRYEDHPVNWEPEEGWFSEFDVRQAAYWSMLSGAAGHTYGDHNIWQMWQPEHEPISSARTPWQQAINHAGSEQMGFMRRLFESRPYQQLVPDQNVIMGDSGDAGSHIRAARSVDASFLFVYSPYGRAFTVDMTKISGQSVNAYWFNPRTGGADEIESFSQVGEKEFVLPEEENRGNDWVLVLDDAELEFGKPGEVSYGAK